jgi:hypothetical protein
MAQFTDPLSHVRVAAPCRADWERMRGNERVRFCDQCSMNVYNLSNMTKKDAEALVLSTEGRLCVRYYNRTDGTILTKNCPVGLRALKRRVSGISRAVVSSVLSFFAGMAVLAGLEAAQNSLDAATEAGLDLISPVPIDEEEAPAPSNEVQIMMGTLAADTNEGWVKGEAIVGEITPFQTSEQKYRNEDYRYR